MHRFGLRTFVHGVVFSLATVAWSPLMAQTDRSYQQAIQRVSGMVLDQDLRSRANQRGLNIVNVLWEDTARSQGSAFGPNISDVTLQVLSGHGAGRTSHLLPVIRYPNFSDRTADLQMDEFWIRVGNHEDGGELRPVPLRDVLSDLGAFLSNPPDAPRIDLTAERDTHVLVSAQHVFLPIPQEGAATFTPAIFNYQSAPDNPAVLTLLVTREGTSITVIENRSTERVGNAFGQQLYYNAGGERAPFTAERRSDVQARVEAGEALPSDDGALDPGTDVLLFVQVPLVHENRGLLPSAPNAGGPSRRGGTRSVESFAPESSDVEEAVLGHGPTEGPFIELNGQTLVRDDRFPIRVTVQFYRATSNGIVSDEDLQRVYDQIEAVYAQGDYVGSLVVPRGERHRPTDWIHTNPEGDNWAPPTDVWWHRPREN